MPELGERLLDSRSRFRVADGALWWWRRELAEQSDRGVQEQAGLLQAGEQHHCCVGEFYLLLGEGGVGAG
jgi:hypothetical protein